MRDPATRRWLTGRRLVRILIGTFVGLLLVGAVGAWRALSHARETIAAHRARLPAESAALAKRALGRPALLEPHADGDGATAISAFLLAADGVSRADRDKLWPAYGEPSPPAAEVDAVLAAHPEPVATLEPLLHVPLAAHPPLESDAWARFIPRFQNGMGWLYGCMRRARERGDTARIRRLALLEATLGCDFVREGPLLPVIVGGGTARVGARDLVQSLALGIGAEEARRLKEAIDVLERSMPKADDVFAVQRREFRAMWSAPDWRRYGLASFGDSAGWKYFWSWDVHRAAVLEDMDQALDQAASEARTWTGRLPLPGDTPRAAPSAPNESLAPVVAAASWVPGLLARTLAVLRVTHVALAVAEFRARTGDVPASIEALVPTYLPAVPLDPWDGKPLRYAAGKVWSIGMDQKDDGGTPPTDPDDIDTQGDFVAPPPPSK